jgi:hypothetical protein
MLTAQHETIVALNGEAISLTPHEMRLLNEATATRLLDLNDGLGVDLQAYVPRLGGWTNIVTFKRAA